MGAPTGAMTPGGVSDKKKTILLILWLVVGAFGAHRFYLGHIGLGVAQLLVGPLTCYIWNLVDGILLLIKDPVDKDGRVVSQW